MLYVKCMNVFFTIKKINESFFRNDCDQWHAIVDLKEHGMKLWLNCFVLECSIKSYKGIALVLVWFK